VTLTQHIPRPATETSLEECDVRWRAAVHDRLADMSLRPTRRYPCFGSVEERDLGDLLITHWECPDLEGIRGSTMARGEAEALLLFTASAGRQIIETRDETVVLRPGAVLIMSTRTTGRFVIPEPMTKRTVRVPLTALAPYDTGRAVPECLFMDTMQNPLARLTQDFLNGVDAQFGQMSPAEVEGARNALLVLIAGMIRAAHAADVSDTDFLPFLRRQLETWIVDHLAGPIRVGELAAAHSVAPRTVHRAFAATGDTVGAVVRAHRLAAARSELVNTACSIAAIAHRWGFCDASHLGREFRRQFSISPGEYREVHGIA
jgi:AraC family transcriptional regulator, positive regulator of tynA and feaB